MVSREVEYMKRASVILSLVLGNVFVGMSGYYQHTKWEVNDEE